MSDLATQRFSCQSCGKTYALKPEWAGKRVKCRCGFVMQCPAAPVRVAPPADDMYDLAPDVAPAKPKPKPVAPIAAAPAAAASNNTTVLGYRTKPAQREADRFDPTSDTLLDRRRDLYVPIALLIGGFALYVGWYAFEYTLGALGLLITAGGLGLVTVLKTALLVGFAFLVAGPVGVSFGGVWTAILKLAAMAVFTDAVTTWVDAGLEAAGAGGLSFMISFPVSLACYWLLMIYLFSMDAGDSWLVVMLLTVFDFIVRWVMLFIVAMVLSSWAGVSIPTAGAGAAAGPYAAEIEEVNDLKDAGLLQEVRAFAKSHPSILLEQTEQFYAAGAKNVWYEVSRDINGRMTIQGMIVEMPKEPDKRQKILQIRSDYYKQRYNSSIAADTDDGSPYLDVATPN